MKENGCIVVKENVTSSRDFELDRQDSSLTRSMRLCQDLFLKAGLDCYRLVKQHNFPKGLYSVYMFVLRPKIKNIHEDTFNKIDNVNNANVIKPSNCDEVKDNQYTGNNDQMESTSEPTKKIEILEKIENKDQCIDGHSVEEDNMVENNKSLELE